MKDWDKKFKEQESQIELLFSLYAKNLRNEFDINQMKSCVFINLEEFEDYLYERIQVAHLEENPMDFLKKHDPTLEKTFAVTTALDFKLEDCDSGFIALILYRDILMSELHDIVRRVNKVI